MLTARVCAYIKQKGGGDMFANKHIGCKVARLGGAK